MWSSSFSELFLARILIIFLSNWFALILRAAHSFFQVMLLHSFKKRSPWTNWINITWELVWNVGSQAPQTGWIKKSGDGALWDSDTCSCSVFHNYCLLNYSFSLFCVFFDLFYSMVKCCVFFQNNIFKYLK